MTLFNNIVPLTELTRVVSALMKSVDGYLVDKDFNGTNLYGIGSKKLCMIYVWDLLPSIDYWGKINSLLELGDAKLVVYTDNFVDYADLTCISFKNHRALVGLNHALWNDFQYDQSRSVNHPTRKFNCFINRVDPVRQSWFYFLHQFRLTDQGYVSFLLGKYLLDNQSLSGRELFDQIHRNHLAHLPQFESSYHQLKDLVPFKNFQDDGSLQTQVLDSKYSLVLDTSATMEDRPAWFVSEKVYRSLLIPTVDLIFVQKGTIGKLIEYGFECSTAKMDIDDLPWIERQQKMLSILQEDTVEYDYSYLREKADHNLDLLRHLWTERDHLLSEIADTMQSTGQ